MRKKISVISGGVQIAQKLSQAADVGEDVRGADVVVLAGDGDVAAVARSAPPVAVIVAGEDVADRSPPVYEDLLCPRARIIGVSNAEAVEGIIESIVFERDDAHEVVAMKDGGFTRCRVRL